MVALFRQYQAGDDAAREQLIHCNLRLVLSVLQRFSNRTFWPKSKLSIAFIRPIQPT